MLHGECGEGDRHLHGLAHHVARVHVHVRQAAVATRTIDRTLAVDLDLAIAITLARALARTIALALRRPCAPFGLCLALDGEGERGAEGLLRDEVPSVQYGYECTPEGGVASTRGVVPYVWCSSARPHPPCRTHIKDPTAQRPNGPTSQHPNIPTHWSVNTQHPNALVCQHHGVAGCGADANQHK